MFPGLFDWPALEHWGAQRCDSCPFLVPRPADVGVQESPTCWLRRILIESPAETCCANHGEHAGKRDRRPLGPVVRLRPDGAELLHPSPDTWPVRNDLLDLLENVRVAALDELSLRQRIALWQVHEFRERRAAVELDRIEIDLVRGPEPVPPPGRLVFTEEALMRVFAGSELPSLIGANDVEFLESFTVAGRVLILASLAIGAGTFWLCLEWLRTQGPLPRFPLLLATFPAAIVAGVYLRVGIRVLGRFGVAFRTSAAPEQENHEELDPPESQECSVPTGTSSPSGSHRRRPPSS